MKKDEERRGRVFRLAETSGLVLMGLVLVVALAGCTGGADVETDEPVATNSSGSAESGGGSDAEVETDSDTTTEAPVNTLEDDGGDTTPTTVGDSESGSSVSQPVTTQASTTVPDPGVSTDG